MTQTPETPELAQQIAAEAADPDTPWLVAVRAAESKKAGELLVLDLSDLTSFTEHFIICTGTNPKQIQAIADEVGQELKDRGRLPLSVEGYQNAEWVLADYGDFLVHVFSETARKYYDLERLWRGAKRVPVPLEQEPERSH